MIDLTKSIRFKGCPGTECRLLAADLFTSSRTLPPMYAVAYRDAGAPGRAWEAFCYDSEQFERLFENVPAAPREWWLVLDEGGYPRALCKSPAEAETWLRHCGDCLAVRVREVLP